ncbi:MAG: sulfatase family protein [Thermoguttaceae bacterium]
MRIQRLPRSPVAPAVAWVPAAAIAILAVLAGSLAVPATAAQRPNIIFLMDDQHRCDTLGKLDPTIHTPALDRLAEDGILFDQAVCQAPMCIPSRYSMMLGLYPTQVGVLSNAPALDDAHLPCEPLPELLRKAGYQTAGFGKTHWAAKTSTRGFEVRYASTDPEEGAIQMSKDNPEGLRRYSDETKPTGAGGENNVGYLGFTSKVPEADHRDGWALGRCLEFLDNGRDSKRPLFLYFSCLAPHAPHNVPPGFEDLYDLAAMPVPEQPPQELVEPCHATGTNREAMYREFWSKATPAQWQQMILRYRANCSWVDSLFGRILDRLQKNGELQNCLVVYVSDHGDMLGERYYRFNKYCLFDPSVRVPVILAGTAVPNDRKGTVDHRPAELVDVLPTILQAAGLPRPAGKPGEDLLGPGFRKAAFCEFNDQPAKISFMWRTADCKLILTFPKTCLKTRAVTWQDVAAGEFYDLRQDPREWTNRYADTDCRPERDRMGDQLIRHLNQVALPRK